MRWRLSKYDPKKRDAQGRYLVDEWTSSTDIGKAFDGVVLTAEAYASVEAAYLQAIELIHAACGSPAMRAVDIVPGPYALAADEPLAAAQSVPTIAAMTALIRHCLRDELQCKLVAGGDDDDGLTLEVGYDYYVRCAGIAPTQALIASIAALGLYLEPAPSR